MSGWCMHIKSCACGCTEARFVGGRSGGPAAAVATGMAYGAVSADLGGTLRLPAAYSGTVGLMASRVSPGGFMGCRWRLCTR